MSALLSIAVPGMAALVLASAKMARSTVVAVANAAVAIAFVLILLAPAGDMRLGTWLGGAVAIPLGFQVDGLSRTFALVTTGVGLLIHAYSAGYMAEERDLSRYFAGLNLFIAAMLTLVLADNFALLLLGWAGVGLASYLLIGFWYQRAAAVAAARKAFLINVLGDVGIMLGVAVLFHYTGALDYSRVFAKTGAVPAAAMTVAVWLLFLGAAAKSAQVPLHTWLPDAMEGPTPVSALIHAATMVTAGVYLLARVQPLLAAAPAAAEGIAALGGIGCLLAALMAIPQRDIKRVLAFSTMSQVGYMFMAAAAGVTAAAVSHVVSHAFFKALLFMGAGVAMHALGGEERDLYKMGGLRSRLPFTAAATAAATLAIAGFPLFSGYFSKDAILAGLLAGGHPLLWATGVLAAGLTALYIFRWYFLAFWGKARTEPSHGEDSPAMRWPMAALALLAIVGGIFVHPLEWFSTTSAVTLAFGLAGFLVAYRLYAHAGPVGDAWLQGAFGALLRGEFGFDAAYQWLIVKPGMLLARGLAGADRVVTTSLSAGVAADGASFATVLRRWQSGAVRRYALSILIGAAAALLWVAIRG